MAEEVEHVFIAMSDGVRLATTLYLPQQRTAPCVLEALPYRKDDLTATYRPEYIRLRDDHGYAVARVDLRGTGSSEGDASDEYPAQEQRDLCEVIGWLARQDWCSGSVGMYGTSYSGFNALQVAAERPPELKAIIAIYATDDRYTDDVHYMGGALRLLDLVDYPMYMVAMNALPPVPALVGDGWRELWLERVNRLEPWVLRWVEEQRDGPYWRHGSLRPGYHRIACPTMLVGGWADGYRNNTLRTVAALAQASVPHRLLLGPWSHMSPATSVPGPRIDLVPEMVRWWDRWLRADDIREADDHEPAVTVFLQRLPRPAPDLDEVPGEWRAGAGWPVARGTEDERVLGGGTTSYDVRPDVGTAAWNSCAGALPWGLPTDQRYDDAASMTWEWPADGLELLGHPRLRLRVTSSAPVASVSAKLCGVFTDGTSVLLSRGLLNLTHRDSDVELRAMPIGEPVDVELELEAMSWLAEPGQVLRLSLAGTDWPNTVAPPAPVTLTVDGDASSLVLPVLAGPSGISPVAMTSAPAREPSEHGPVTWRVERDVLARTTSCVVDHGSDYDVAGGRVREHYAGTVTVDTVTFDQQASASADFTVTWPDAEVRSRAELTLAAGPTAFDVVVTLAVDLDGQPFGERRWERRIERDLG